MAKAKTYVAWVNGEWGDNYSYVGTKKEVEEWAGEEYSDGTNRDIFFGEITTTRIIPGKRSTDKLPWENVSG